MDKSLIITADMIALESMNPSQLLNAIPTRLPKFMDEVKGFVHSKVATLTNFWGNKINASDVAKITRQANYFALSQIDIFVPTGLQKDYLGYVLALQDAQRVANVLMTETLRPTSAWLSELLGRPETLQSIRESHQSRGLVFHDIKNLKNRLNACLDGKSNQDKIGFGKVFRNNNEFVTTVDHLNTLNKEIAAIDRHSIEQEVNHIVELMDKLLVRMQQNADVYKMSGMTMNSMAKVALNLAEEVEFFAAYYHLLQVATTTMDMTLVHLLKVTK